MTLKVPSPQGFYNPAARHGDIVFTSGMTPRQDGKLLFSGAIKLNDTPDQHREAVRLAAQNALMAARSALTKGEKLGVILQLQVFLNCEPGFAAHPQVANFASEYLAEELGAASIGSRAAIGVSSLPSNATVEITLTAAIDRP
ncbi:RidA family protein [Ruegeria atlantica]|uniref:RidA family protein n=1 Tax=Ruegeria atlantica TaxID=81569 RepID=UPI00147D26C2|nr:RidA family protein [Ruegeria atlantica]